MKSCIILCSGESLNEGIDLGLWKQIKGKDIWGLNSIFKYMPYNPTRQLWVDVSLFRHEAHNLQLMQKAGVQLHCKYHIHYAFLGDIINQHQCCREREFYSKNKMKDVSHLFIGQMGLVGFFATSLAIKEGYETIYLLGSDWGTKSNYERKTHCYQDKIKDLNIKSSGAGNPGIYLDTHDKPNKKIQDWKIYLKEDVKIYNVSPNSNIECFEKIDYPTFFKKLKEHD